MAKALAKQVAVKRQGRRVMPALRRTAKRARVAAKHAQLTLGELIAAAYETVGGESVAVARVVSSPQMAKAIGRRIVFV